MKLTPMRAIKEHCRFCMGGLPKNIKECTATKCILYKYTKGRRPRGSSPTKDMRRFCLECAGGYIERRECTGNIPFGGYPKGCPLFGYRFGHRPKVAGYPFQNLQKVL